jgi:putative ABC transport system permease protein
MRLPLSYNLRNLMVRRTTTLLTAFGIGMTVAVLMAALAMVEGLRDALEASANPLHLLVMRKGSTSELVSSLSRSAFQRLRALPGIARTPSGEPMASLEMIAVIVLKSAEYPSGVNVSLRGLTPVGFAMREYLRVSEGRMLAPGRRELVVGKVIAARYPEARIGGRLRFGRGDWEVVGVADGGRSASNSEIFADLNQIAADYNRTETLGSALVRADDPVALRALMRTIEGERTLNADAQTERDYFDSQTISALPVRWMTTFIAIVMAVGSGLAAMNTMYASVARRSAEIGTLRVLGFSRGRILLSFLIEALMLSALGGALGCLLALPLTLWRTGLGNFVTFSEIAFHLRVTPSIAATGMAFALLMGILGGLLPARAAARKEILTALRSE